MKLVGFFLLLAGWFLVLSAVVLLRALPAQTAFASAGVGVEVLGFVLVARHHLPIRRAKLDR